MSLAFDLLEQANHLARREPRRPRQASLRRAVSTAYYALFHHLVGEASRFLVGGRRRAALRFRIGRAFGHRRMKAAARAFSGESRDPWLERVDSIPTDLTEVASSFLELQEARHAADYDLTESLDRAQVLSLLREAEHALERWRKVRGTPQAEAFLLALLVPTRG